MPDTLVRSDQPVRAPSLTPPGDDGPGASPRFLVVIEPALSGAALERALDQLASRGGAHYHLVARLQLPSAAQAVLWGDVMWTYAVAGDVCEWDDGGARADADVYLNGMLERLHRAGTLATGEVSETAPLTAVRTALQGGTFDGVIVCGRRRPLARWLHLDLAHRLARRTDLPVSYLSGH